jgi:hypothetical protein
MAPELLLHVHRAVLMAASGSGSGTGSIQLPPLPTTGGPTGSSLANNGIVQIMLQVSGWVLGVLAVFVAIKAMFALLNAVNRGLGRTTEGGVRGRFLTASATNGMPVVLVEITEIGIALVIVALVLSGTWTSFLTTVLNIIATVINDIMSGIQGATTGAGSAATSGLATVRHALSYLA